MNLQTLLKKKLIYKYKNKEGYYTKGWLNLSRCTSLKTLPDGLVVGGWLNLSGCTSLKALPDGLVVGGWLDLSGCTLYPFPSDLKVGGEIIGEYEIIYNSKRFIMED